MARSPTARILASAAVDGLFPAGQARSPAVAFERGADGEGRLHRQVARLEPVEPYGTVRRSEPPLHVGPRPMRSRIEEAACDAEREVAGGPRYLENHGQVI